MGTRHQFRITTHPRLSTEYYDIILRKPRHEACVEKTSITEFCDKIRCHLVTDVANVKYVSPV